MEFNNAGMVVGTMICEALGLAPNDVREINLSYKDGVVKTITASVVITDKQGRAIIENDAIKTALRTFRESDKEG